MTDKPKRNRRIYFAVLLVGLAVCLFCLIYPVNIIRPNRSQNPRDLAIALAVMRFRGVATVICVLTTLAALVIYWQAQCSWWRRSFATLGAALLCVLGALSRVNIYEALMFHPDLHPTFAAASRIKLGKGEKVITVKVHGVARAYPIRNISYHHVINDVIDKVAIVATY